MNAFSDLTDGGDDRPGIDDADVFDEGVDDLDDGDDDALDDDDYPEDADESEIDLVVGLYREDGAPVATAMAKELANDFDDLCDALRRFPADGGAIGLVSIADEFFVVARVRGQHVQVVVSDATAAGDWPIARDVVDYLGLDVPDEEEDLFPAGDLGMLADLGVSDFDLETLASNYDDDATALLSDLAGKLKFGPQYVRAVQAAFGL